jgi:hypothetical protein
MSVYVLRFALYHFTPICLFYRIFEINPLIDAALQLLARQTDKTIYLNLIMTYRVCHELRLMN